MAPKRSKRSSSQGRGASTARAADPDSIKEQVEKAAQALNVGENPVEVEDEPTDLPADPTADAVALWRKSRAVIRKAEQVLSREEYVAAQERELRASKKSLGEQTDQLARERDELERIRLEAEAGFMPTFRETLDGLSQQVAELRQSAAESFSDHYRELAERQEQFADTLAETEQAFQQRLAESAEGAATEASLRSRERQLETVQASLDAQLQALDEAVERRVELVHGELLRTIQQLKMAADLDKEQLEELTAQLMKERRRNRAQAVWDPEEVEELRGRLDQLRTELKSRPSQAEVDEAMSRVGELEALRAEVVESRAELNELRRQLLAYEAQDTDLEATRDRARVEEARARRFKQQVDELMAEHERLMGQRDDGVPFPACTAIDREDEELEASGESEPRAVHLESLVDEVQLALAYPSSDSERSSLVYSLDDLRFFLGGMAMSKLHILQGISGTGKTSLPMAFGQIIGGLVTRVEVSSGWREPQDLLGYYNSFEKRYLESKALTALYRAGSTRHRGRPHIIVLDEMNLSHPEQYFSDFLSIIEDQDKGPVIDLRTSRDVSPQPRRVVPGQGLPFPSNVWFVGTINNDDTTTTIAPKTYDRAHVMEAPPRHPDRPRRRRFAVPQVSVAQLQRAFASAAQEHSEDTSQALGLFGGPLRDAFAEVGVGWGNRLERQLRAFVPVVRAAGGTTEAACDHLLRSKVVAKLETGRRHDQQALQELHDALLNDWARADLADVPQQSASALSTLLR